MNKSNKKSRINKKIEILREADIHDFTSKLLQKDSIEILKKYVLWQYELRNSPEPREIFSKIPDFSPISINLDLTTSCNYACDHCVDMDILNTSIRFNEDELMRSVDLMVKKGLKSVIIIGGGEPTVAPNFTKMVQYIKERGVAIAIVTNGSRMQKIQEISDILDENDWVRLSLDSGCDETFQLMHKPKKKISLEEICLEVSNIKTNSTKFKIGYSFIVTWKGAIINDRNIVENINEIPDASFLAKKYKFDYLSVKPFLERSVSNNAEIIGIDDDAKNYLEVIKRIRGSVQKAKEFEDENFSVIESTNLQALEKGLYKDYTIQPKNCHITYFRQVLSPLGVFNCPVYRHVNIAKISDNTGFSTQSQFTSTKLNIAKMINEFDASENCKKITCVYNTVNWFIEDLIQNPQKLDELENLNSLDYYL